MLDSQLTKKVIKKKKQIFALTNHETTAENLQNRL